MLQRVRDIFDLTRPGRAAQLLSKLETLGQTRGADEVRPPEVAGDVVDHLSDGTPVVSGGSFPVSDPPASDPFAWLDEGAK